MDCSMQDDFQTNHINLQQAARCLETHHLAKGIVTNWRISEWKVFEVTDWKQTDKTK